MPPFGTGRFGLTAMAWREIGNASDGIRAAQRGESGFLPMFLI
jgi:hypothetical protein